MEPFLSLAGVGAGSVAAVGATAAEAIVDVVEAAGGSWEALEDAPGWTTSPSESYSDKKSRSISSRGEEGKGGWSRGHLAAEEWSEGASLVVPRTKVSVSESLGFLECASPVSPSRHRGITVEPETMVDEATGPESPSAPPRTRGEKDRDVWRAVKLTRCGHRSSRVRVGRCTELLGKHAEGFEPRSARSPG